MAPQQVVNNSGRAGVKEGTIRRPKSQAPKCEMIYAQHNTTHA